MMPPIATVQYPTPLIQVFGLSGVNFVSLSTTPQMPLVTVVEVKVESMTRVVRRTWKKYKDDE
jgi:hypothetical protein